MKFETRSCGLTCLLSVRPSVHQVSSKKQTEEDDSINKKTTESLKRNHPSIHRKPRQKPLGFFHHPNGAMRTNIRHKIQSRRHIQNRHPHLCIVGRDFVV